MYNIPVPTPFYHISVAEDLLAHPDLNEDIRCRLQEGSAAFFFGNTAPDVQVVSGQRREETHFFPVPIPPKSTPPWELIGRVHPLLVSRNRLSPQRAAFMAGWLCHLQADWYWVRDIYSPIFGFDAQWSDFRTRLYLHNVLRSYLDYQIHQGLNGNLGGQLAEVFPDDWLPFVDDKHLAVWRDLLVQQLQPDSKIETVEVFAARQGIPTEDYYRLIGSETKMDRDVFNHISRPVLKSFRQDLIENNLILIHQFFDPN